jgi:hypothetical protein
MREKLAAPGQSATQIVDEDDGDGFMRCHWPNGLAPDRTGSASPGNELIVTLLRESTSGTASR